jgi:hypothetical protein
MSFNIIGHVQSAPARQDARNHRGKGGVKGCDRRRDALGARAGEQQVTGVRGWRRRASWRPRGDVAYEFDIPHTECRPTRARCS